MNIFKKISLKIKANSKEEYKQLKREYKDLYAGYKALKSEYKTKKREYTHEHYTIAHHNKRMEDFVNKGKSIQPNIDIPQDRIVNFKHSGKVGDIIYSIPAIKALCGEYGADLYLNLNVPVGYPPYMKNSSPVMLNRAIFEMVYPLLMAQPEIKSCKPYHNEKIDVDLDLFRELPLDLDKGHISRWHFLLYPGTYPLNEAWLNITEVSSIAKDAIILARSQRYIAPGIDYSFLKRYPKVLFIGLQEEYQDMKERVPNIIYQPVSNFLEMASLIAGAKLFIGNQSSPFAIAEGLKVNRLLEVYFDSPHVIPEGNNGFEFCFQEQFEKLVKMRYENI